MAVMQLYAMSNSYLCPVLKEKVQPRLMRETPPNNSFNRSANSGDFIRETWPYWRFVAPG